MRIAYIHANFWPYWRRGAERFTYELASYMSRKGHTVDVITTKPGRDSVSWFGDVRVIYLSKRRHPLIQRWRQGDLFVAVTGLTILPVLLAGDYDIIHCWMYHYAPAAYLATRRNGGRYLYHNMLPEAHLPHTLDRFWFQWAAQRAAAVMDLTYQRAAELSRAYGIQVLVIPPPVNLNEFQIKPDKKLDQFPVLFASSLAEAKKGVALLVRAFNYVLQRCDRAVLQLAGTEESGRFPEQVWNLLDSPQRCGAVQFLGAGTRTSLSRLYAEAAVTVLPSLDEPFGMVLLESLASGTPVVGMTPGGPAEVITPEVGTLVTLNSQEEMSSDVKAKELAEAILRSIALTRDPATAYRCRERAKHWDVETIGAQTEALYQEVL